MEIYDTNEYFCLAMTMRWGEEWTDLLQLQSTYTSTPETLVQLAFTPYYLCFLLTRFLINLKCHHHEITRSKNRPKSILGIHHLVFNKRNNHNRSINIFNNTTGLFSEYISKRKPVKIINSDKNSQFVDVEKFRLRNLQTTLNYNEEPLQVEELFQGGFDWARNVLV